MLTDWTTKTKLLHSYNIKFGNKIRLSNCCNNKGKQISLWKKNELNSLIEIQKSSAKYKKNARPLKWLDMAQTLAKLGPDIICD